MLNYSAFIPDLSQILVLSYEKRDKKGFRLEQLRRWILTLKSLNYFCLNADDATEWQTWLKTVSTLVIIFLKKHWNVIGLNKVFLYLKSLYFCSAFCRVILFSWGAPTFLADHRSLKWLKFLSITIFFNIIDAVMCYKVTINLQRSNLTLLKNI